MSLPNKDHFINVVFKTIIFFILIVLIVYFINRDLVYYHIGFDISYKFFYLLTAIIFSPVLIIFILV